MDVKHTSGKIYNRTGEELIKAFGWGDTFNNALYKTSDVKFDIRIEVTSGNVQLD